jgi:glycerol-3-phosphate O-acyltransferase
MLLKFTLARMEKDSTANSFKELLTPLREKFPHPAWDFLEPFMTSYGAIIERKGLDKAFYHNLLVSYGKFIVAQLKEPYKFGSFHEAIRSPIDYYQFGIDFFTPLIDFAKATFTGKEHVEEIAQFIAKGDNVILYANHQIEADPQVLSIFLKDSFPNLAKDMLFVAGERVVTDPLAVPFSLGCNLFCVFSKKYFEVHAERKAEMLEQNKRTMLHIAHHLHEGGKCIYIAPSGGRDRPNPDNPKEINLAAFDQQSIELLYLLGRKAKKKTHFYPLALKTHDLLPPPNKLQISLGEKRIAKEAPVHIAFGQEIAMEDFPQSATREEIKEARTERIWSLVRAMYETFPK